MKYTLTRSWYNDEVTHFVEAENPKQAFYRTWKQFYAHLTFKEFIKWFGYDFKIESEETV